MSLSSGQLAALLVGVVAIVGLAGLGLYLRSRLQRRRLALRSELAGAPEVVSDRAFNRLAMARREVDVVARQGTDVTRARALIAEAQAAFDTQQFDRSYQLAHSAHESLVAARSDPSRGPRPAPTPLAGAGPVPTALAGSAAAPPAPTPPPAPLAKNRAESQFQIRLLAADVDRARAKGPGDGAMLGAQAALTQAQAAFDRGDYTEAFRLALKGRRQAGGSVESLAAGTAGGAAPLAAGAPADPLAAAEQTAAAGRCPRCGTPLLAGDGFCRGCGAPRSAITCPSCGAPRRPTDTFCGKCGASFA